jgi:hypothetical protein
VPDIDTAAALTLEDDPLALATCARYNGAGYDVRLELLGLEGSICAGLDQKIPLRSAEPGESFPAGPADRQFMDRFHDAYVAELTAFTTNVAIAVTRHGHRSAVISRTGEDPFGRYAHRALREFGVDDCFVTGMGCRALRVE